MRRVFLAAVALVVALSCAATARPAATFAIRGHGWGHGLGLAQYGAYGYARDDGRDFAVDHRPLLPGHYSRGRGVGRVKRASHRGCRPSVDRLAAGYTVTDANGRHVQPHRGATCSGRICEIVSANGQTRTLVGPVRFNPGGSPLRVSGTSLSRPAPRSERGRPALRRQRPRPRAVRQGRRRPRDAVLLAPRGAQGPGGGRPHVRARQPEDRLLVQPL